MADPSIDGPAPPRLPVPPVHPRRIAFLGSPALAVPQLQALHEHGYEIPLVVTGVDKRRGRGSATTPTPVKAAALELGLPLSHDLDDLPGCGADMALVVAFGRILRRPLLEVLPMVNLHYSLLPRWRGAAPIERALLAGDTRTGVCLMAVEEGLDTGAVYARWETAIGPRPTLAGLVDALTIGARGLLLQGLSDGLTDPTPQHGETTYASKITAEDRHLVWDRPATELSRVVAIGGSWTTFRRRRLQVVEGWGWPTHEVTGRPGEVHGDVVSTGRGGLQLVRVKPEGKPVMAAIDWLRGARLEPGERLGADDARDQIDQRADQADHAADHGAGHGDDQP